MYNISMFDTDDSKPINIVAKFEDHLLKNCNLAKEGTVTKEGIAKYHKKRCKKKK